MAHLIPFLVGLALALFCGSLVEYALHRSLHSGLLRGTWLWQIHLAHHMPTGRVQRWWREGLDYCMVAFLSYPVACPVLALTISPVASLGCCLGAVAWAFWAGWCHERGHGDRSGAHATHHRRPRSNFGLGTSFWDVVFGTWRSEV
jgi:sterol desaturase/sphingolipid hydroxylase (fatty acid hydroxylase superfamily)